MTWYHFISETGVVQSLSDVPLCDPMNCCTPGFPVLHYLPKLDQTHVHWVSDAIQPCHPLSPPLSPPTLNLSQHQCLFPKNRLFASSGQNTGPSASVITMNIQYWFLYDLIGLISFAVQGTLKSLLQHHNSKAWILWPSKFFMVQLSHSYMTTGKIIALTRWTFVGKMMSLLFNMLV